MSNIFRYMVFIMLALAGIATIKFMNLKEKSNATVIILNGPSASGKSSTQKAFQQLMLPELWVKVGIDNLFDYLMPDITLEKLQEWRKPNSIRWVEEQKDAEGNNVLPLFVGEEGMKTVHGMNSAIAAYAKNGCNIIVDYIAYQPEWMTDLKSKLKGFRAIYVGIDIPLEKLEEREQARATSPSGHARSHYDTVHQGIEYDLRIDTSNKTPEEIAKKIKTFIENN